MGRAKQRKAMARLSRDALPSTVACTECHSELLDFKPHDVRGVDGLRMAASSRCPSCGYTTMVFDGEPQVVEAYAQFLIHERGADPENMTLGVMQRARRQTD